MRKLAIITDANESMHCYAENDHVWVVGKTTFREQCSDPEDWTKEELDQELFLVTQQGSGFTQTIHPGDFKYVRNEQDLKPVVGLKGEWRPISRPSIGTMFLIGSEVTIKAVDRADSQGASLVAVGHHRETGQELVQYITWTDFSMNY